MQAFKQATSSIYVLETNITIILAYFVYNINLICLSPTGHVAQIHRYLSGISLQ